MNRTPWPRDGEVHIHSLTLPLESPHLTYLCRHLSASESERAGSLKSDRAQKQFITGRSVLRDILGGYLAVDPGSVPLGTGEHGKPFLTDGAALRFNLSHAGDLMIIAVAAGVEVGVDIEKIEADKPFDAMARLAFSSREQEELHDTPPSLLASLFYRCWTRKEACLKACGSGFSLHGNSFDVTLHAKSTATQLVRCGRSCWHVLDIGVPHPYCAALAVEALDPALPPPALVRLTHPLSQV